jgi:hypothetical protein
VPAPISPLIGFLLGVAFAWAAAEDLARSGGPISRPLVVVSLFGLLVFAPVAAYFLAFAPDWAWAYTIDAQQLPSALDFALVLADAASTPAGFVAASRYAKAGRTGPLARLAALPLALVALFLVVAFRRLGVMASYSQYHGDFGVRSVSGGPLGYALLWMTLVLGGGVAWTAIWLRRSARAVRRG